MDGRALGDRLWRAFLSNLGTKLVSIAIAIVLWLVVLESRNFEVSKDIPLEIVTPADIVPANDIPDHISFRLSGPKAFLRAVLDRPEEPIRVNLAGAKPALVTYRFFSDNIRVPIGVKVLSINPTAILIKLEYLKRRDVPVHVELRGVPPEGYRVVSTTIHPELVRIKGAESKVEAVTDLETTPIDVSNLRHPLDREAPLDLSRLGVQLDGPVPRALVDVEPISANFKLNKVAVRVLTPYRYKLDEKTVTVSVRAEPKDIRTLDPSRVYGVVDLTGKPKGTYEEPVKVVLPEDVGLVKVVPDRVNVTLY